MDVATQNTRPRYSGVALATWTGTREYAFFLFLARGRTTQRLRDQAVKKQRLISHASLSTTPGLDQRDSAATDTSSILSQ